MTRNILIFAVAGVALAAAAWWGLSGGSSAAAPILSGGGSGTPLDPGIVETLLQLQNVTLTSPILKDPAFIGLQDFNQDVREEPLGRPNPFLILQVPSNQAVPPSSKGTSLFMTKTPK